MFKAKDIRFVRYDWIKNEKGLLEYKIVEEYKSETIPFNLKETLDKLSPIINSNKDSNND